MEEIWKEIEGYEGLYEISNLGRVRRMAHVQRTNFRIFQVPSKIIALNKVGAGYMQAPLRKEGKTTHHLVHRLVAKHFIPNPNNLPQVNHLDEDKTNNIVTNLQWVSPHDNLVYGHRMEKIRKPVLMISRITNEVVKEFDSITDAANFIGKPHNAICMCLKGKRKSAYKYYWKYK